MSNPLELVKFADIARFVDTHENAREAVDRAARMLSDEQDAIAALRKVLPALSDKRVKVFFSYKRTDERAAAAIIDVLIEGAGDNLDISHMGTFTQEIAGKQWRSKIRESVRAANWFILLLPNPSDELDWCLYETGLFEAQLTSADRLICLHHPDTEIPSPIEGYQAVAATQPELEKFLRMAFVEENAVPGMASVARWSEKRIPDLARRIVDAIRAPSRRTQRKLFVPAIDFRLDGAAALKSADDLDAAVITSANPEGLDVFGYEQFNGTTFGELRSSVEEHGDARWRDELFHVIRKIAKGQRFQPVQAVLKSPNGKVYRPVAYAVDRGEKGQVQAYALTFAEDVTAADLAHTPAELAMLATLLRYAFRFRWEVLERFAKGPLAEEEIRLLEINLTRITVDWQSQGARLENGMSDVFAGVQAQRFRAMIEDWHELRRPDKTGKLDKAIADKDGKRVSELLAGLLPVNQEFLAMAADRFSEMMGGTAPDRARSS